MFMSPGWGTGIFVPPVWGTKMFVTPAWMTKQFMPPPWGIKMLRPCLGDQNVCAPHLADRIYMPLWGDKQLEAILVVLPGRVRGANRMLLLGRVRGAIRMYGLWPINQGCGPAGSPWLYLSRQFPNNGLGTGLQRDLSAPAESSWQIPPCPVPYLLNLYQLRPGARPGRWRQEVKGFRMF